MNDVTFRAATIGDADALTALYLTARRTFLPYAPLAHTDADVRHWIAHTLLPTGTVTVALHEGEIIGMMALSRTADNTGWLEQFYLRPGRTGQGIGARLLEYAKAQLGSPVRLYVFQENTGARRFYERHGFQLLALSDGMDNEERCPDALYEWRLGKIAK